MFIFTVLVMFPITPPDGSTSRSVDTNFRYDIYTHFYVSFSPLPIIMAHRVGR